MGNLLQNTTISSIEVAEMIGMEHSKLLRAIRNYIKYLDGAKIGLTDFFIESEYITEQNRRQPCYFLTKKGCDLVANKLTGSKGTVFTAKYVTRFEQMQNILEHNSPRIDLEANREAINVLVDRLLIERESARENADKVKFADTVASAKDTISMGEMAKLIYDDTEQGRNTFMATLRADGYLLKDSTEASQKAIKQGLLVTRERVTPKGVVTVSRVTGKGQLFFTTKYKNLKKEEVM